MLSRFYFFFNWRHTTQFYFLGTGADFFQQLKLDFLDTLVKALNHKTSFLQLLLVQLRLFNLVKSSKYMYIY